jgi:colanic acid/amylovoran biosynthesis glycosyltransferase
VSRRRPHLLEVGVRWPPETFLRDKFEGLCRRGYRVTVAAPAHRHRNGHAIPGVEVRRLPEWDARRPRVALAVLRHATPLAARSPRRLAAVVRAVRARSGGWDALRLLASYLPLARIRPDVVHFEWNGEAVHHLPLFAVWGRPVVVSCHGAQVAAQPWAVRHGRLRRGLPETFRRASAVHCVSHAMVGNALVHGLDPAKAWLIPGAVDTSRFEPDGGPPHDGTLRLAAVGHLRWEKGYDYALAAVRRLADAGLPVRLDVVGGGFDRRRTAYAVADLGLADRVNLHGATDAAKVRELLRRAHVLLHASVTEGLPVAVLEAMACGVPVVATDCGGTREAVADGVEGIVVPPRDPAALAEAVEALWRDPVRRRAMGAAGRERVRREFELRDHVERFAELYEHLARSP